MSEETKQPLSAQEYFRKRLKDQFPNTPITLWKMTLNAETAMRWAHEYMSQQASPLHVRIAELEAENVKYFKELMGLRCYKVGSNHIIERLEADLAAEKQKAEKLAEALDNIVNPIMYLQKEADKEGATLHGQRAIEIGNSANFLKDIASKALASHRSTQSQDNKNIEG